MEALQWANDVLKRQTDITNRLESPMLDAEVLLSAALEVNKTWLFTHLDYELTAHQSERYRESVNRRATHEPVAYIVGTREFYKRDFAVNRFVLIPRPATEVLVEHALQISSSIISPISSDSKISSVLFADIGTGSGAIAITLASESKLPVIATDISKQALVVAKTNAQKHHVEELVDFQYGNLADPVIKIFKSIGAQKPFQHLILCANLPYLSDKQVDTGQHDVRDFEPREALVAGHDGLDAYWNLFRQLKQNRFVLPDRVTTLIEIDPSQNLSIQNLIRHAFPHSTPQITNDLECLPRVVITEI